MKLGIHFTLDEFTQSQTAVRKGIDNTPSEEVTANLEALVRNILDPLRERLGQAITISSGYRSPVLNKAVGGAKNSQHLTGEAADINCPAIGTERLFDVLRASGLPFDQLIEEGTWVHVSFGIRDRREVLRATFVNGKAQYTKA